MSRGHFTCFSLIYDVRLFNISELKGNDIASTLVWNLIAPPLDAESRVFYIDATILRLIKCRLYVNGVDNSPTSDSNNRLRAHLV